MVNQLHRFTKNQKKSLNSQQGAIYIWMLLSLIFLSLGVGQWAINYATIRKIEKEQDLLRIGLTYRNAIQNYYQSSPGSIKTYPGELDDLLKDPRYFDVKRYMRKLEKDPMTSNDFELVRNSDGKITGIRSSSNSEPIKKKGFNKEIVKFNNATSYKMWIF